MYRILKHGPKFISCDFDDSLWHLLGVHHESTWAPLYPSQFVLHVYVRPRIITMGNNQNHSFLTQLFDKVPVSCLVLRFSIWLAIGIRQGIHKRILSQYITIRFEILRQFYIRILGKIGIPSCTQRGCDWHNEQIVQIYYVAYICKTLYMIRRGPNLFFKYFSLVLAYFTQLGCLLRFNFFGQFKFEPYRAQEAVK